MSDPLLAPPQSLPASPLLADERPPIRPPLTLLDVNPITRRMENLDALRIVSMLVIVATHVTEPYVDSAADTHPYGALYQSIFALNVACRVGVPCFLMISFFIYWHQLYDKHRTWPQLLLRRFKRLIPAFLVWSLVYVAVHRLLKKLTGDPHTPLAWIYDLPLASLTFWKQIFLLGRAETHLYYLPMVMTCLLLIPLLKRLWRRPLISWTFVAFTLIAWIVVYYGSCLYPPDTRIGRPLHRIVALWQDVVAIPLLVFPLLGMMCAGQLPWRTFIARTPRSCWLTLLLVGLALHVTETLLLLHFSQTAPTPDMQDHRLLIALAGLKPGRLLSALALFVLFIRNPLLRDPFPRLSHYAFGLHFMHPLIILALTLLETHLLPPAISHWQSQIPTLLLINFTLTVTLTFSLCLLLGRSKRLQFLIV